MNSNEINSLLAKSVLTALFCCEGDGEGDELFLKQHRIKAGVIRTVMGFMQYSN